MLQPFTIISPSHFWPGLTQWPPRAQQSGESSHTGTQHWQCLYLHPPVYIIVSPTPHRGLHEPCFSLQSLDGAEFLHSEKNYDLFKMNIEKHHDNLQFIHCPFVERFKK